MMIIDACQRGRKIDLIHMMQRSAATRIEDEAENVGSDLRRYSWKSIHQPIDEN